MIRTHLSMLLLDHASACPPASFLHKLAAGDPVQTYQAWDHHPCRCLPWLTPRRHTCLISPAPHLVLAAELFTHLVIDPRAKLTRWQRNGCRLPQIFST
ncbi:hypothetical protein V8D89_010006 [Ganoderma adspersum]